MATDTKLTLESRNSKVLNGIDKNFADTKKLTIGGVDYTAKSLSAIYQADTDAMTAAASAKKAYELAVANEHEAHALTAVVTTALKNYILGFFGVKAVIVLGDFGFAPPKSKGKKTVAVKAAAIEQATATRAARHTMGPNQKKKVKGTVAVADETAATSTGASTVPTTTAPTTVAKT